MNGLQVAREIHKNRTPIRILALSAYEDNEYILGVLECGADGYLTKDEAPDLLVKAVRRMASGEASWLSRRVYRRISSPKGETNKVTATKSAKETDLQPKRRQEILEQMQHLIDSSGKPTKNY